LKEAIAGARREPKRIRNGDVYVEKLLVGARHIEFQVLADMHGNTIHLGERECFNPTAAPKIGRRITEYRPRPRPITAATHGDMAVKARKRWLCECRHD